MFKQDCQELLKKIFLSQTLPKRSQSRLLLFSRCWNIVWFSFKTFLPLLSSTRPCWNSHGSYWSDVGTFRWRIHNHLCRCVRHASSTSLLFFSKHNSHILLLERLFCECGGRGRCVSTGNVGNVEADWQTWKCRRLVPFPSRMGLLAVSYWPSNAKKLWNAECTLCECFSVRFDRILINYSFLPFASPFRWLWW